MASYYYLMAQLPSILPHTDPPLSYSQFKELALRFLDQKDASMLEQLALTPRKEAVSMRSALLTQWYGFEHALRLALEKMRAAKLKQEGASKEAGVSSSFDVGSIVRAVSAIEDPLAAEQFLLQARLSVVEDLRRLHHFDSDAVFGYGLALLLSERASKFKMESGRKEYHSIYTQILGEKI